MFRFAFCASLMLLASSGNADSVTQNDWSGGQGVWGPVISFGDEFYSDSGVECYSMYGGVSLDLIDQVWAHDVAVDYNGAQCALTADIDGDGDLDVIGIAYLANEITWWENADGIGSTWIEHTIETYFYAVYSVCSGDFDGDGDADVAAVSGSAGADHGIAWWENLDGSGDLWSMHFIDQFPGSPSVCSEDVDGDGSMDILAASLGLEQVAWWENLDGTGMAWMKHVIDEKNGCRCACFGDVDGDGVMDVIGAVWWAMAWWENLDGTGTAWTQHNVDGDFDDPFGVHCADVNGDGDPDIIGASNASGVSYDVSWWENADGVGGSWTKHVVDGDFWGARSVDAADIDEDGDMDILGASYHKSEIVWWENLNGSGTSWRKHLIDHPMGGASSVCAEDINGDGILDILGVGYLEDLITWYDVKTYPPEGWLVSSVLDVSCGPDWSTLAWTADAPAGTAVAFQVRSSANPDSGSMGPWSDTLYAPCSLHGILPDWEQYFQYKAILTTSDIDITPSLQSVTVTWDPLGVEGGSAPGCFELLPVHPNPTAGTAGIEFGLPCTAEVGMLVFDISGRLVQDIAAAEYQPGWHEMQLSELSPGVYFVRMTAGEFEATQRFVVVD